MQYVQAEIKKDNLTEVAWLEDKNLKVGNVVELKTDNGYDPGWVVTNLYSRMNREDMLRQRDAHKNHRKATDI